jgi:Helicase HerA, central domain
MARPDLVRLRIHYPRAVDADAVRAFLAALAALPGPSWPRLVRPSWLALETHSRHGQIEHYLVMPSRWRGVVLDALRASLRVRVEDAADMDVLGDREGVAAVELGRRGPHHPLRSDHPDAVTASLLAALQAGAGEELWLQWIVTPAAGMPSSATTLGQALGFTKAAANRRTEREIRLLAVARLMARAHTAAGARALLRRPLSALVSVRQIGTTLYPRALPSGTVTRRIANHSIPVVWPVEIGVTELAGISGIPIGTPTVPGLRLGVAPQLPPAPELSRSGALLLHANYPGAERPVAITPRSLTAHLVVAGSTGSGKSTLITTLAASYMRLGFALVLVDPKGDTARDVMGQVPRDRLEDVIYLDAGDAEAIVGFNPLGGSAERLPITVDEVVAWFRRRYTSWGPRVDDLTRHALLALGEAGLTLAELPLLLSDDGWRRSVVTRLSDPAVRLFFGWFDNLSGAERAHVAAPLLTRARAVLRHQLRAIVGQVNPGWSMEGVLSHKRILIANLAKGSLGSDAAALLGSLLCTRLWQATLGRAALPATQRDPALAIIEEFPDFVGNDDTFGDALAQSRGLGVGWTLIAQRLGMLGTSLRSDVLTNARSKAVFALAADEAAVLAPEFAPLTASDLQSLGAYEVAARIYTGSTVAPPVTGTTIQSPPPSSGYVEMVQARARERYARDRRMVEAEIQARHGLPTDGPIGKRRRTP